MKLLYGFFLLLSVFEGAKAVETFDLIENVFDIIEEFVKFPESPDLNSAFVNFYFKGEKFSISEPLPQSLKTKIVKICAHGFNSDHQAFSGVEKEFNQNHEVNVVRVEWDSKKLNIKFWEYIDGAINTQIAGYQIASLIQRLVNETDVGLSQIHLIGHSLGAHAVGWAGAYVQQFGLGRVPWITGLDPAYPGFSRQPKITPQSADMVEIIHTNAQAEKAYLQPNDLLHLGFSDPLGHYDFYPNGGFNQPGTKSFIEGHSRAIEFYEESVANPTAFKGKRCESYNSFTGRDTPPCRGEDFVHMGPALDNLAIHGKYYFCTNGNSPYTLGDDGLNCKVTVCDIARNSARSTNLQGLTMNLENMIFDDDISPNDKEFVGIEEIDNSSPATIVQIVKFSKESFYKYEMYSQKCWGVVLKVCANAPLLGVIGVPSEACWNIVNSCGNCRSHRLKKETQSEFNMEREITVPPHSKIHVCSILNAAKDGPVKYRATARYTAPGLWAAEIAKVLARDEIYGELDDENDAVLVPTEGEIVLTAAMDPQLVVGKIENGESVCTVVSRKITELEHARGEGKSEKRMAIFNDIENLITGYRSPCNGTINAVRK